MAHEQFFNEIGLTNDQATVYEALLKSGESVAKKIVQSTGLKRGLVYKILEQLTSLSLVNKRDEEGKVTVFIPAHPQKLRDILSKKEEAIRTITASAGEIIGSLSSQYNLITGKPNVQFFEGEKGIEEVLDDSLYAKSEILSYVDVEAVLKYIPKANASYVAKREKYGIKKKMIVLDTPFNRDYLKEYFRNVTDTRFLLHTNTPFKTVMQIYDNKVSYLTLSDKETIGVIIEDENIAYMHRYIFEYLWNDLPEIKQPSLSQNQDDNTDLTNQSKPSQKLPE